MAGTAVVAELVLAGVPRWRAVAAALALIAVLLWLWYLALVARGFWAIIVDRARGGVNGAILLSAVSTQSIVILTPLLVPHQVPRAVWAGIIILGYLFYVMGLVFIVRHYRRQMQNQREGHRNCERGICAERAREHSPVASGGRSFA